MRRFQHLLARVLELLVEAQHGLFFFFNSVDFPRFFEVLCCWKKATKEGVSLSSSVQG